jgi:TRAP-type C4-dicarboxylate transport system permease small subunit
MPSTLDRALALAHRVSAWAALAGGALLLAAALLVAVEVVLRRFAGITFGGSDELSGYALAIGSTWSFAYVLLHRGNIRVDAIYHHLPQSMAALLDLLAIGALLAFFGLVTWHGTGVMAQSWTLDAHSNTALGIALVWPQALWWVGYAWLLVCGLLLALRGLQAFAAQDWACVRRLLGVRGTEEEALEEIENSRQLQRKTTP